MAVELGKMQRDGEIKSASAKLIFNSTGSDRRNWFSYYFDRPLPSRLCGRVETRNISGICLFARLIKEARAFRVFPFYFDATNAGWLVRCGNRTESDRRTILFSKNEIVRSSSNYAVFFIDRLIIFFLDQLTPICAKWKKHRESIEK